MTHLLQNKVVFVKIFLEKQQPLTKKIRYTEVLIPYREVQTTWSYMDVRPDRKFIPL